MSIESRIEALEGVGADRIIFELWMGRSCPGCGVPVWMNAGQTREMSAEDTRGCAKVTRADTPAHRCKVNA